MLQHTRMTRSRLYVLIDSFENDMRNILTRYVLEYLPDSEALGHVFEKASQRRSGDDPTGTALIASYLDLQEAYDILNRHREMLPEELGIELRKNTTLLNQLVPIRNRVMHGRPLVAGDPELAINCCVAFNTRYWNAVKDTLDHLQADPAWEPAFEHQGRRSERILNNLPLPEYDETGLIGRSADCKRIANLLMRRREPVITITGEGGIGKTAVALEVAYSVLDNADCPYECILWASLKTERLTASGVQDIANAVRDITGAASVLGKAIEANFDGSVTELAEILRGIETLVIIDNLETVDGSEVIALYETLPDTVTYLFTSRIGIGQFERKINLGPLPDHDAQILFRSFARSRGEQRLAKLTAGTLHEVVERLRYSPLAIRWYVLAVEAGERPDLALTNQAGLLDFCVRSVYSAMPSSSKAILTVLLALDRATSYDELAILTDMGIDNLRRAIHDLLNGSMVVLEPTRDRELVSGIRLTEAARQFLRKVAAPHSKEVELILARELEYRKSDEHRRADESARMLAPNVVRVRSEFDKPTAHLLRLALVASREDTLDRALELTDRARSLNPEYWEVDRVEAFILSHAGQTVQATATYRNALRNADDNEGKAVVSYYFAGHLARRAHELEPAIDLARTANQEFRIPETGQQLGSFLVWNDQFEEGQEYLIDALEEASGKLRLITLTSLVDSWVKWSEALQRRDHRSVEAASKAYTGFVLGANDIRTGTYDRKLAEAVIESGIILVRAVTSEGVVISDFERQITDLLSLVIEYKPFFETCANWHFLARQIGYLHRSSSVPAAIQHRCASVINPSSMDIEPGIGRVLTGNVISWVDHRYGFISHPEFPRNVFFHLSAIEGKSYEADESLVGKRVSFEVPVYDAERPRAERVELLD